MKPTSAMTVIENKGKVLILKDRRGRWTLPGGQRDQGETLTTAAKRETWEETGLFVKVTGKGKKTKPYSKKGQKKAIVYPAKLKKTKKVKLSHEHKKYKWATPAQAKDKLIPRHAALL